MYLQVFGKGFYNLAQQPSGLQDAGDALGATYGAQFKWIWGVGLLASGQIATISLTYAGARHASVLCSDCPQGLGPSEADSGVTLVLAMTLCCLAMHCC
jgi:Mn2+/Fe2+ NRAMP family transporter